MDNRQLLIGWATRSITPDRPIQLQGQFYERISERVRDPITATALALATDGDAGNGDQAIIVSCDLTHIPDELQARLRGRIRTRAPDIDTQKVFLAATHTHTAPVMREGFYPDPPEGVMRPPEYVAFLLDRLTEVVIAAWQARRPGGVSWALGHAALGFNRRVVYADGETRMYGHTATPNFRNLEGTCDHGIEMLFCWDRESQLTGIVINPACPSQVVENQHYISADYWSAVRTRLREKYGDGVHVLPLCSAAGDQSPRDLVRRGRGEPDMHDEAGLEEKGQRVTRAVDDVHCEARSRIRTSVPFVHCVERLQLPARPITPELVETVRLSVAELESKAEEGPTDRILKLRFHRILDACERRSRDPRYEMELHVLRLGDVALATNPFELFLDYGLRIKAQSKAVQTFVVQLAGWPGGYLPTQKALAGGGYGATITEGPVGPEGGDVLVTRTVERINSLWAEVGPQDQGT